MELWKKLLIIGLSIVLSVLIIVQGYAIEKYQKIIKKYEKLDK